MPIYVYDCACGQVLDIFHSIAENPDIECNNCDSMMQRKIQNIRGVSFKGKGFAINDQGGRASDQK